MPCNGVHNAAVFIDVKRRALICSLLVTKLVLRSMLTRKEGKLVYA